MNAATYILALQVLSAFFALAASLLWFKAGSIKTPAKIEYILLVSGTDGSGSEKGQLGEMAAGLAAQGWWNARAALCAALASLLQISTLVDWQTILRS
jgi:hypothetical protein